ncbi:hypothetical protein CROQUDRAFT_106419 [Cronartium quercuum f. sp. fusiforme G11]|uniref:Uncharacterized protein n=1 Tax=Cronartium quercuum f. sp. fusiforme G11 TaxID=708437 RepID=A0A9P6NIB5_9BASI|nr:hypothetical protein CROQUDRAFT_106419 [Cronartium quercuum f. sp. fusiforme G11]
MKSFTFVRNMLIIMTLSHYLVSSTLAHVGPGPAALNDPNADSGIPQSVSGSPSIVYQPPKKTKYSDIPHTFCFDFKANWTSSSGNEVYDSNGNVVYRVSHFVNHTRLEGRIFVILDVHGKELLRVFQTRPSCGSPLKQRFHTSSSVIYKWDLRAALPDRWHIQSPRGYLPYDDYVYRRARYHNQGSITPGFHHHRVARISRNDAESGWELAKIKSGKVGCVRTNNQIPIKYLLGLVYSTIIVYDHCPK